MSLYTNIIHYYDQLFPLNHQKNRGRSSNMFKYMSGEDAKVRNHYSVLLEIQSQGHEEFEKEVEEAFRKEASPRYELRSYFCLLVGKVP